MYVWWVNKSTKLFPKFWQKKIFPKKFSEKFYFWPFLVKNSINLVSLQSSIDVGMHTIAQNDRNKILLKWVNFFQNFSPQKFKKFIFSKMSKMTKKSKTKIIFFDPIFSKNLYFWPFLVRSPDSRNAGVSAPRDGAASSFGEHAW